MPTPRPDESKDDFIARCMSDQEAQNDFPDEDQRLAFCESQWEREGAQNLLALDPNIIPGDTTRACISNYFGIWLIESLWLRAAVEQLRAGNVPEIKSQTESSGRTDLIDGNIAKINIVGQTMKQPSKFGGTSTLQIRRQLRSAGRDPDVKGVLLHIDSPGGSVAGTADLADDVATIARQKPLVTHADDLMASAALWVGSQANQVFASKTTEVGSIGTAVVVEDSSGVADAEGIRVHVVSTGPYKGAFEPGAPVTDEHLAYLRERVESLNQHFLKDLSRGRNMKMQDVQASADGRVFGADDAKGRGLIDGVQSLDASVSALQKMIKSGEKAPRRNRAMAELMEAELR